MRERERDGPRVIADERYDATRFGTARQKSHTFGLARQTTEAACIRPATSIECSTMGLSRWTRAAEDVVRIAMLQRTRDPAALLGARDAAPYASKVADNP